MAEVIQKIKNRNGKPLDPDSLVTGSVMSVMFRILFGCHIDSSDARLHQTVCWIHELFSRRRYAVMTDLFPLLRLLPKLRREMSMMNDMHVKLMKYLDELIETSFVDRQNASYVSCFCDAEGPGFDRSELLYLVRDLVLAGAETTPTTLKWALLLLANHPDVQTRCQQQIDSVVTVHRLPSLNDRPNLPYLEATVHEIMRCKTITPMSVPHETLRDTNLAGHFVPARTMVKFIFVVLGINSVLLCCCLGDRGGIQRVPAVPRLFTFGESVRQKLKQ